MVHSGSRVYLLLSAMMVVVNISVFAMLDPDPHKSIVITSEFQVKINPGIDGDGSAGSEPELCQLLSQSRCHEAAIKKNCPWTCREHELCQLLSQSRCHEAAIKKNCPWKCRGSKLPTYNGPLDKIWTEDQCKIISVDLGPDWSVPDCQDQCNKETDCNGFIYNPDDGLCWTGQCPIPVPQPVDYYPPWVGYYIGNITAVTTEAPPTKVAITEAPSTEAPLTEAPRTEAPSTEAPTIIAHVNYEEVTFEDIDTRAKSSSSTTKEKPSFAFKRNGPYTWHSNTSLPQSLWYEFPNPIVINKFSFQSRQDLPQFSSSDGPSEYIFWGSNAQHCEDSSKWVTLFEDNSGTPFSSAQDIKEETFENSARYKCYGFKVINTPGREGCRYPWEGDGPWGGHCATIANVRYFTPKE